MTLANRIRSIESVRGQIFVLAHAIPTDRFFVSPYDYDWSAGLILHHLMASEQHFIAEFLRNLNRPAPDYDRETDPGMPRAAMVEALLNTRSKTLAALACVAPEEASALLRSSSHPILVARSGLELLDFMAIHEARHGTEIEDILAKMGIALPI